MDRRRINRSKKVPGVKLRPARPDPLSRYSPPPSPVSFGAPDELENSFIDTCPRPFRGYTICTTGIDRVRAKAVQVHVAYLTLALPQSTIFPKAGEMGANTTAAFTDYVTHLIAEEHGGAKYWCAVERKIPILKPSWITDTFEIWQRGDDFDFDAKVEEHRLPVFAGTTLCVSGIEDLDRRTTISSTAAEHGGKYVKSIERPVRVTHLLCAGDGETDKMHYARKFNERGEADIKLVWEEWFWDSLEFGGRFEETPYLVTHPRPERKQPPPSQAGARRKIVDPPQQTPSQPDPDAPEEEEIAVARRVPTATLRVWESLLAPRGYTKVGTDLVKTAPVDGAEASSPPPSLPRTSKGKGKAGAPEPLISFRGRSALATFSRSKSFAPAPGPAEDPSATASAPTSTSRQPFRKTQSLFLPPPPGPEFEPEAAARAPTAPQIFAGLRFRVRGEARSASVRAAIEGCGGTWVDADADDDERVDYVVVRLVSGSKLCADEPDAARRARYRTECWLEGCLARERVCAADEHPAFAPLPHAVHVRGVTLSPSRLD
ncbi:hypothetical protein BC834DRAFT_1046509, partial [Gloeopeniophorella convolvens]